MKVRPGFTCAWCGKPGWGSSFRSKVTGSKVHPACAASAEKIGGRYRGARRI